MIGGNKTAILQVKTASEKNAMGARVTTWTDCTSLTGYLDLSSGDSKRNIYDAKIQESTHIFLCDFNSLTGLSAGWLWDPFSFLTGVIDQITGSQIDITSDNARMVADGQIYEIKLIDDPMGLHEHLEIYLKYIGGQ